MQRKAEAEPILALFVGATHITSLVCSFCDRHNREVRVAANDAGLIICQGCVAKASQFDDDVRLPDRPELAKPSLLRAAWIQPFV